MKKVTAGIVCAGNDYPCEILKAGERVLHAPRPE